MPSRPSCLAFLLVFVAIGLFDSRADAQNRRRRRPPEAENRRRRESPEAAEERETVEKLIETLVKKIETRPSSISNVIDTYNGVERQKKFSLGSRHRLHKELLDALRLVDDRAIARVAASLLRTPSKSKFAGQVLMMKTLVGESFPAPRQKRIDWLVRAVTGKRFPLTIWGLRLLGEAGWPEAVDALIEVMDGEEAKGRAGGTLWQLASRELYRILGGRTAYATAGAVRAEWKRRDMRIPEEPDYSLDGDEDRPRSTAAFFGDQISPRSVFLIDVSGSMKQTVTLRPPRSAKARTGVEGQEDRGELLFGKSSAKIEVVKKELERAVGALQPVCEFNVLKYSDRAMAWKMVKGKLDLVKANPKNLASATAFARGLRSESGTNIYEALDDALQVPDVDTIYLLSDGAPSVGGDVDDIRRNVARRNYLKGVRIVTYGFAPERGGGLFVDGRFAFDEPFMKGLAATNWGWYRRLNKVTKGEGEDGERNERPRFRRRRRRR